MKRLLLLLLTLYTINAFAQKWEWAQAMGAAEGFSNFYVERVSALGDSGLVVAGHYTGGAFQWGSINVPENGNSMAFAAALDATGALLWFSGFGDAALAEPQSVVSDQDGNVYVGGHFSAASFIAGTDTLISKGVRDGFLVKLNAQGEILWAISIATAATDFLSSLSLDTDGNVYAVGFTEDFSSGNSIAVGFIVKISPDSEVLWFKTATSTKASMACADIKVDELGHFFVACGTVGDAVFEQTHVIPAKGNASNVVIAHYNANGQFVKGIADSTIEDYVFMCLAADRVYLTGIKYVEGDEFYYSDLRAVAFDRQLNELWDYRTQLIDRGEQSALLAPAGIAASPQGDLYISGFFAGAFNMGEGLEIATQQVVHGSGYTNAFLLKLDETGIPRNALSIGDSLYDQGRGLALLGDGKMAMLGNMMSDTLRFGPLNVVNESELRMFSFHGFTVYLRNTYSFIARFDPNNVSSALSGNSLSQFILYPNPSQDHFFFRSESFSESPVQVQIFSTDGKLLSQQNLVPNGNSMRVETATLPPGMYVVGVMADGQMAAERFIKY